ncbi:endoplasmic reticulum junction formation protein lunapark-like isoform X2 [Ornithodoros turicata]|uniref:endoplasmic reticulum junction formation protein lunapark-like isoform X2 n=1 Tax=Ornithodoros turicata TaxID=34597 RepID=UPI0031388D19
MGVLWSRFKRKPGTKDLLEDIEKRIADINDYKHTKEKQQKRLVGALISYSCLFYILVVVITYIWYFPDTVHGQLLCAIPLVLFPVLIMVLKKLLQWYFRRKIELKNEELADLIREKKSVLNNVMETETFKVAREILEKYDPETLKRSIHLEEKVEMKQLALPERGPAPGPPLPRPILPRERTAFDRIIDFMVGEGPSSRYALICSRCFCHNGMALKEEYEYLAFRCCYCFHWNAAKKQRPELPKVIEISSGMLALPSTASSTITQDNSSTTVANATASDNKEDESEMETCDEGVDSKASKEECSEGSLIRTRAQIVDASGDIVGIPREGPRHTRHTMTAPRQKSPQSKKVD